MLRKPHVVQAIRQAITDELGGDLAAKALQVPRQIIDNKGAFFGTSARAAANAWGAVNPRPGRTEPLARRPTNQWPEVEAR